MAAAFQQSNASFLRVEINLVKVCSGLWLAADSPLPSSCPSRRFWVHCARRFVDTHSFDIFKTPDIPVILERTALL